MAQQMMRMTEVRSIQHITYNNQMIKSIIIYNNLFVNRCSIDIVNFTQQLILNIRNINDSLKIYICLLLLLLQIYNLTSKMERRKITENNTLHELGIGSPRKIRVQYKRYLNQLNDTLQSLITAGKLKRMELITINNRALFNRAKVQRSQWINHNSGSKSFEPDTSCLILDSRLHKFSKKQSIRYATGTVQMKNNNNNNSSISNIEELQSSSQRDKLLNKLIDVQIQKIRDKKLLKSTIDRRRIVMNACRQIQQKLVQNSVTRNNTKPQEQTKYRSSPRKNLKVLKQAKKSHKRSVTQNIYMTSIDQINKKEELIKKQRKQNQKYFIRKLKKTYTCQS